MAVQIRDLERLHDDAALVVAAQAGDQQAFAELFRRHHDSVRRICARRMGDIVEADEVAQAAFVKAYERIEQCTGERRFGGWVQVIAQRLCIDAARARSRTRSDEDPLNGLACTDQNGQPEQVLLAAERSASVHRALALLPDRQREVVVARHLEGRRPPEIAAALGLSVGAVDSLLLRARRRLLTNYQNVMDESGVVTAHATTAVTGLVGTAGAVADPGRFARVFDAMRHAADGLALRFSPFAAQSTTSPSPGRIVAAVAAMAMVGAAPLAFGGDAPSAGPTGPSTVVEAVHGVAGEAIASAPPSAGGVPAITRGPAAPQLPGVSAAPGVAPPAAPAAPAPPQPNPPTSPPLPGIGQPVGDTASTVATVANPVIAAAGDSLDSAGGAITAAVPAAGPVVGVAAAIVAPAVGSASRIIDSIGAAPLG